MVAANDLELERRDNAGSNTDDADDTADGDWSAAVSTVDDDTETDDVVEEVSYRITSYGVDFDVQGLVRRMNEADIFVPDFQRGFVWTQQEASKFIESLLLDLPVPGIFLTLEPDTEKMMVIDGQQRLKSLQYFYAGEFEGGRKPFALQGVNAAFEGKRYVDLREPDRRRLGNSLFHATISRQLFPEEGMSGVFHIFQRLNSTGRRLTPQEIRQATYRGELLDCIRMLNSNDDWRAMFGRVNPRQKDQELILRFWAMHLNDEKYAAPMMAFLNRFAEENRNPSEEFLQQGQSMFVEVVAAFNSALGNRAFRIADSRQLNAAVFDSMTVGLARRIKKAGSPTMEAIRKAHSAILADADYNASIARATATEASVRTRIQKATAAFEAA